MNLWLDDIRVAPDGWKWVKSYNEAVEVLSQVDIANFSLDHDLGLVLHPDDDDLRVYPAIELAKTGYDLVLWMIENDKWPDSVAVHSANPVGSANMCWLIERHGPYEYKESIEFHTIDDWDIRGVRYTKG